MKKLILLITTPVLAVVLATSTLFSVGGCANFSGQIQSLESPAQFKADLIYFGSRAKPYVSATNQAKIHQFATVLGSSANLDLGPLFALLPSATGNQYGDMALATAKTILQLAVIKFGSNNGTTLAYAHAGSEGLLANF